MTPINDLSKVQVMHSRVHCMLVLTVCNFTSIWFICRAACNFLCDVFVCLFEFHCSQIHYTFIYSNCQPHKQSYSYMERFPWVFLIFSPIFFSEIFYCELTVYSKHSRSRKKNEQINKHGMFYTKTLVSIPKRKINNIRTSEKKNYCSSRNEHFVRQFCMHDEGRKTFVVV